MRAKYFFFAVCAAGCGGAAPELERAASNLPDDPAEAAEIIALREFVDPGTPVPMPPPGMADPAPMPGAPTARDAVPGTDTRRPWAPDTFEPGPVIVPRPTLDEGPPRLDIPPVVGEVPFVPGLGLDPLRPVPPIRPGAMGPRAQVPPLLPAAPPARAFEPTLNPRVWVSMHEVRVGDAFAVAAVNVPPGAWVMLAQGPGAPPSHRFCGSGIAGPEGVVRGACRVAPGEAAATTVHAYAHRLAGPELAAAAVLVHPLPTDIFVGAQEITYMRFVPTGGRARPFNDVGVVVHDPYGDVYFDALVKADLAGYWHQLLSLPLNATLGRWTIMARETGATRWSITWFDVTPVAHVEVTPDLFGAYVMGLRPYDPVRFQLYDAYGFDVGEVRGGADRTGVALVNDLPPLCGRTGTWFIRMAYRDARGDEAFIDLPYDVKRGWCID